MTDDSPRYLALKAVMMPRDTNPYGTIFGGVLLSYIDQAGAVGAKHVIVRNGWPARTLVTVGMQSVSFHEPVLVGDVVSFWTEISRIGTTSMTMHVVVETERERQTVKLTEADVTYVAVELEADDRRPVPIRGEAAAERRPRGARARKRS
jgi:acyl-CoA thioesterase YciA